MRIYVVGAEGQVARSLREVASRYDDVVFRCSHRPDVDLLNPASIETALEVFRPDVVVNPAAYTAVDRAESESALAFALNRDGAGALAAAAARLEAPIIHLSTDYVFDGNKSDAYVETDAVAPQSVYGHSKLAGEEAVMAANPHHLLLRTAWVYAPFGNNFVRTMLRLGAERDRIRVVDDQLGCPTYAPDIAEAIINMARAIVGAGDRASYSGVVHLAGPDAVTWCGFARAIFAGASTRGARAVAVDPIRSSDYPTPAVRPANSRLSTAKLASLFDIRLPSMESSLSNCLDRLLLREKESF
jgi:dTDP-4-dehydrorhamnose reductase